MAMACRFADETMRPDIHSEDGISWVSPVPLAGLVFNEVGFMKLPVTVHIPQILIELLNLGSARAPSQRRECTPVL